MEWISRVLFTPQQKAERWERWKSGQCIASIARTLGRRNKSGVYRILAARGGLVPAPRRRARLAVAMQCASAIEDEPVNGPCPDGRN